MHIEENKSLKQYNTFGIDSNARYFISVTKRNELKKVLNSTIHDNKFILGGGSNLLLTKDIEGLVIHIDLKGIKILKENGFEVCIKDVSTHGTFIDRILIGKNQHVRLLHGAKIAVVYPNNHIFTYHEIINVSYPRALLEKYNISTHVILGEGTFGIVMQVHNKSKITKLFYKMSQNYCLLRL